MEKRIFKRKKENEKETAIKQNVIHNPTGAKLDDYLLGDGQWYMY